MNNIRKATKHDIDMIVALSDQKRREYAKSQPQFWKIASNANEVQAQHFKNILESKNCLVLVAEVNSTVQGFCVANIMDCPSDIYKPCIKMIINELCVSDNSLWNTVGKDLFLSLRNFSENVEVFAIECAVHDESEQNFLNDIGFSPVTKWYSLANKIL